MIKFLKHLQVVNGVSNAKFSSWVHRKFGEMIIYRTKHMGIDGTSLPCVLCRKAVDKNHITWNAYDGDRWINSNRTSYLPKSKSTSKQKRNFNFIY